MTPRQIWKSGPTVVSTVIALSAVGLVWGCGGTSSTAEQATATPAPAVQTQTPGNIQIVPAGTPTATPPPASSPAPGMIATPPPTPVRSPTVSALLSGPTTFTGTVIEVIDGDIIDVVFDDGTRERVRMLGIDTPEINTPNKPNEFGTITDTVCLYQWGLLARQFVDMMWGRTVTLVLDPLAGERDSFSQMQAYVLSEGIDVNSAMAEGGLARAYAETETSRGEQYRALEERARSQGQGLWECEQPVSEAPPATSTN